MVERPGRGEQYDAMLEEIDRSFTRSALIAAKKPRLKTLSKLYRHGYTPEIADEMRKYFAKPIERALFYLGTGEDDGILDAADECMNQKDTLAFGAYLYARVLGEKDRALDMIDEYEIQSPQAAWIEAAAGQPEGAIRVLENQNPSNALAIIQEIIIAYGEQGKTERMLKWVGEYRSRMNDVEYGKLLLLIDPFLPGLQVLESGLDIAHNSSELDLLKIRAFVNRGEITQALELVEHTPKIQDSLSGMHAIKRWIVEQQWSRQRRPIIYRTFY